jgi:HTH-type transcriptional regulator/antitoxin HigA
VSPGRIIRKELEARGWSQVDLARILGRPEQTVSEIVQGRKKITPETAIGLAQAFGTSAEMWLGLEARYRLAEARKGTQYDDVRRRSALYSALPLREIIKRGWIADAENTEELEDEVRRFLEVQSLDSMPHVQIAARRTATKAPDERAVLAWLRRVQQLASLQNVARYDRSRLTSGIGRIISLSESKELVPEVPVILGEMGIRFVIVPHLHSTYMDGAVLSADGEPVVALTLRYDRLDNFWFTLVHELEHLIRGHRGSWLECLDEKPDPESEEAQADEGAAERLVPAAELKNYVRRVSPYFSKRSIEVFAASIGRHPSIVLGRLHHDGHVSPAHLRSAIPRVRCLLESWIDTPAAVLPQGRARTRTKVSTVDTKEGVVILLGWLQSNPGWHSRSEALAGTGLSSNSWIAAIKDLVDSGLVDSKGQKRGRRYRAIKPMSPS